MSFGSCTAVLKTASRANPALPLPYRPRARVTLRTASRNVRRYDWIASSGSVVQNDPVNRTDPTGTQMDSRHLGEAMARREANGGPKVEEQAIEQAKIGTQVLLTTGSVFAGGAAAAALGIRKTVEVIRITLSLAGVKAPSQTSGPPKPPIVTPAPPRSSPTGGRKPPEGKSMTDGAKPTGSEKPKVESVQKPNRD
jgi:hypothetical protein